LCLLLTALEHDLDAPVGSDGEREVVECRAEPVAGDFGSDVVVTAAQILHDGVTGGEAPRRAAEGVRLVLERYRVLLIA
jgi:hypothetical protein